MKHQKLFSYRFLITLSPLQLGYTGNGLNSIHFWMKTWIVLYSTANSLLVLSNNMEKKTKAKENKPVAQTLCNLVCSWWSRLWSGLEFTYLCWSLITPWHMLHQPGVGLISTSCFFSRHRLRDQMEFAGLCCTGAIPMPQEVSACSPLSSSLLPRHTCQVCAPCSQKLCRDAAADFCDPFVRLKWEGTLPSAEHHAYILLLLSGKAKVCG